MKRPILGALALLAAAVTLTAAQGPDRSPEARRVDERIRALQQEAARLANESKTLVAELQQLEVERQLRVAEAGQADAERLAAEQALRATTERLAQLEQRRVAQLPDIKAELVETYKRGRGGYARLLFAGKDLRDFARSARAVSALVDLNARRIAEHRQTIEAVRGERVALEEKTRDLATREVQAKAAGAAADRALSARTARAAQIDSRRDLTAQYVGELQVAYERLQQVISGRPTSGGESVVVPLAPFRGALEWPVDGRIAGRFGETADRLGGAAVRNGIEVAAAEGAMVRAVHGGTVRLADLYTGFGTLVILDHGGNTFSLYGYLDATTVSQGQSVETGTEVGRVGTAPDGMPELYFEMRIDGRPVDPLQWLKRR
jgi:septal ring factor EnvC (AmiA/AmiB activator)